MPVSVRGVTVVLLKKGSAPPSSISDGNFDDGCDRRRVLFVSLPLGERSLRQRPDVRPSGGTKAHRGLHRPPLTTADDPPRGEAVELKPASLVTTPGWTSTVTVSKRRRARSAGRCAALDRPIGSAVTDAEATRFVSVTTDAAGKYVLENLLPGDYNFPCWLRGRPRRPEAAHEKRNQDCCA